MKQLLTINEPAPKACVEATILSFHEIHGKFHWANTGHININVPPKNCDNQIQELALEDSNKSLVSCE